MLSCSLKDYLENVGLTQEEFAEKSGVSQSTVSRVCSGGVTSAENMRAIYEHTGGRVNPNWIVLNRAG